MLLDNYLPHLGILSNSVFTHTTVLKWAIQLTEYSDLCFGTVYCGIIMQHKPMKYILFKLILQFNFSISDVFYMFCTVLRMNPWRSKHAEDIKNWKKINQNINLKSVHFVGSFCIRIFWHYGQRKQTSPCLILINLLFDHTCKGKKGTYPSDLAIALSGRHNTHLFTLSSMSVAH